MGQISLFPLFVQSKKSCVSVPVFSVCLCVMYTCGLVDACIAYVLFTAHATAQLLVHCSLHDTVNLLTDHHAITGICSLLCSAAVLPVSPAFSGPILGAASSLSPMETAPVDTRGIWVATMGNV